MQKLKALTNSNLFKQMLFAFGILSISRLVWFVANVFWLPPIGIDEYVYAHLVGIYFDIPVVALIYLPVWIWVVYGDSWRQQFPIVNRILFVISSMVVLIFNGIDTGYSQVTAKRSGFELFDTLGDDANRFAPYLTDNWYIILGLAAIGYLIFRWVPTPPLKSHRRIKFRTTRNRTACHLHPTANHQHLATQWSTRF
jgi:hypothetical protein